MSDKIFINYRRADSIGTAGRLGDRLAKRFGKRNLFMDVDSIRAGVDFVADLEDRVGECRVFLVVIGPNWLDARDEIGRRRLDCPEDFVRIEIAAALARDIRVIPVLVDGAQMPKAEELPASIKSLVRRNAVEVRNTQFGRDAEALMTRVREALGGSPFEQAWRRKWVGLGAAALAVIVLVTLTAHNWIWTALPLSQREQPRSALLPTKIFYQPSYAGARLDFCYKNGVLCGKEAAIAFCKSQNYNSVADQDGFEIDPNIWGTRTLAGDQNNGRDGFRFIKCVDPLN
jgi:hypothetical protein